VGRLSWLHQNLRETLVCCKYSRCAGEGAIEGEIPISVSFPPGLTEDHAVVIPLERFGISNTHLTILFRPSNIYY
jgi:hypothetical protein